MLESIPASIGAFRKPFVLPRNLAAEIFDRVLVLASTLQGGRAKDGYGWTLLRAKATGACFGGLLAWLCSGLVATRCRSFAKDVMPATPTGSPRLRHVALGALTPWPSAVIGGPFPMGGREPELRVPPIGPQLFRMLVDQQPLLSNGRLP